MKTNRIRIVVILGFFSIVGIIIFQMYWVYKTFDTTENQFNQTVKVALYNVAEKMAEFNGAQLPNKNPVKQVSSNYYVVDINDIIDANILDHYLKTEFEYSHINIDYEYAIYDCESNEMLYGNYVHTSDESQKRTSKHNFPKYDEYTYYFGIYFPSKTTYILNNMNIWIISSFVLITAIGFFVYAIFIILRQKRLSEIQKDFINNMTHEFKTPISTISISADVLMDPEIKSDPPRLSNYASIIKDQNYRLENQIEKVLQLARIEKRKMNLTLEDIDLHDTISNIVKTFTLNFKDNHGKIKLDLQANDPVIKADNQHLTNLVYNLLDNAVKFSKENPEIMIKTIQTDHEIKISFSDKGIGIDKKYIKKIFNKFFRIPTGNVYNVKGFGLGLNYVKNIVNAHNWKISVDSEPGKGSTFVIYIPIS